MGTPVVAAVRIEWSSAAVGDLHAITGWIEQDRGSETANRIARRLYEAVQSLRSMPYLIVYQISEERLLVLNILHGAQRWP